MLRMGWLWFIQSYVALERRQIPFEMVDIGGFQSGTQVLGLGPDT